MKKLIAVLLCDGLLTVTASPALADVGADTYKLVCSSCHESAVAGAPKPDDKAEWKRRAAKGKDALFASIVQGRCKYHVQELRKDISDETIKLTVAYMVDQAETPPRPSLEEKFDPTD